MRRLIAFATAALIACGVAVGRAAEVPTPVFEKKLSDEWSLAIYLRDMTLGETVEQIESSFPGLKVGMEPPLGRRVDYVLTSATRPTDPSAERRAVERRTFERSTYRADRRDEGFGFFDARLVGSRVIVLQQHSRGVMLTGFEIESSRLTTRSAYFENDGLRLFRGERITQAGDGFGAIATSGRITGVAGDLVSVSLTNASGDTIEHTVSIAPGAVNPPIPHTLARQVWMLAGAGLLAVAAIVVARRIRRRLSRLRPQVP